jgi:hypothetical protein
MKLKKGAPPKNPLNPRDVDSRAIFEPTVCVSYYLCMPKDNTVSTQWEEVPKSSDSYVSHCQVSMI